MNGAAMARAIRVLIVVTIALNIVYLGALLVPGSPAPRLTDFWLFLVTLWVPTCVFWLIAIRMRFRRWEVNLAAAGLTLNVAAQTLYAASMDSTGYLASPSIADIGYVLCYPLTMASLIVLVRRQSRKATRSVVFDSTLASLGASAVLAAVLLPEFDGSTSVLDSVILTLYPLADIMLIAVVVGISASPFLRMGPRWQFLVLGLLLFAGADIAYAVLVHNDAYAAGTPLDAAWSAGFACVAVWMNGVDRADPAPTATSALARTFPVPALAVLAGLGVLLAAMQRELPAIALILAAAAVALAAVPIMFRHATLARLIEGQEQVVDRLTALDKSKSDIIGTVSHEMRTPLTSILGFLEIVLDDDAGAVPEETKKMLRVADRNARRLENMVGNMLVLARLESGGDASATTPVDVGRVLSRAAESLRPYAESRSVEVSVHCDGSVVVEGDESQIERVFINLLENAVKFTPAQRSVRVEVGEGATRASGPEIVVTVADKGIGIPAEEVPHLFDRFFRATNARDGAVPGTGLGLAIANEIVQAHQGDIEVTSELGEGTTFRVTLPTRQAVPVQS